MYAAVTAATVVRPSPKVKNPDASAASRSSIGRDDCFALVLKLACSGCAQSCLPKAARIGPIHIVTIANRKTGQNIGRGAAATGASTPWAWSSGIFADLRTATPRLGALLTLDVARRFGCMTVGFLAFAGARTFWTLRFVVFVICFTSSRQRVAAHYVPLRCTRQPEKPAHAVSSLKRTWSERSRHAACVRPPHSSRSEGGRRVTRVTPPRWLRSYLRPPVS
jgi:hypothetical protein